MKSQMIRFARGSKCVSFGANGLAEFADDSPANIAARAIPPKPLPAREKNSRRVELPRFAMDCLSNMIDFISNHIRLAPFLCRKNFGRGMGPDERTHD